MAAERWRSRNLEHGIHAYAGGAGTQVVLLPGWPETADAYGEIFPLLAAQHSVLALDPPGLGDSAPSTTGYDTASISRTLAHAVRASGVESYHLVAHDIGSWIAYAWAAQFPGQVKSLTLLDAAIPGLSSPQSYPLPYEANIKLWQLSFNILPDLPEILVEGRETALFDWLFKQKAKHPERISEARRARYVECYARPGGMARGFAYYRAAAESAGQNIAFSKSKLAMPLLALGGEIAMGDNLRKSVEALAIEVQGGVVKDCGHYLVEEQPEQTARTLLDFFQQVEDRAQ